MSLEPEIHEATRRLVEVLDRMEAPYAIGGAVSMAFVGFVRATRDVDVLALVPAVRYQEFAVALSRAGFAMRDEAGRPVPPDAIRMATSGRDFGYFRLWWGDTRVEVFCPKVPLQDAVLRRRVRVDLGDFSMWITTAEDLIALKMIFHRPKDIEDVRRLIAANRDRLDAAYLRAKAAETLDSSVAKELDAMLGHAGLG